MTKRFSLLAILLFFIFIPGCAGVRIVKITHENPYEEGIRFYAPHPYLWVTKDTSGNLQASIVWFPNKNEEYAIKVKSGIGSVDTKFTLENGWNLTQFGETRDSKTPELITALTGSLKDIREVFAMVREEELHAGLYMFIFDEKIGLVSEIKPVIQFR
jgi:hypothetical protein